MEPQRNDDVLGWSLSEMMMMVMVMMMVMMMMVMMVVMMMIVLLFADTHCSTTVFDM